MAKVSNENLAFDAVDTVAPITSKIDIIPKNKNPFGVDITWENLRAEVQVKSGGLFNKKTENKVILDNINGCVQKGQLVAIMGSSGAGKTTFLNILASQNTSGLKSSGKILVNGEDLGSDIVKISSYVQQQDMFYGALTVRQHLLFHANLRDIPNPQRRVQEVLDQMGLSDIAESKIGTPGRGKTISGGERKRLSFATEILQQPPLLFCDEPTSGLDSYLANQVVESLRKISESGTTVLCTIHQPSSDTYNLFDNLILLAKGKCAFLGTRLSAIDYFNEELIDPVPKNYNPCDHFINSLSIDPANKSETEEKVAKYCEIYKNSKVFLQSKQNIDKINASQLNDVGWKKALEFDTAGFGKQIYWLFWRSMIVNYTDPLVLLIKIIQVVILSVIFGIIYLRVPALPYIGAIESCIPGTNESNPNGNPNYNTPDVINLNGAIFIMLTNSSFTYVFFVVTVFPLMLPIWVIENGKKLYSVTVAFIATNLSEVPTLIFLPFLFTCVCYWMFGLYPYVANFLMCYLILLLVAQSAVSFGYMLSTFTSNIVIINAIAAPLLIPLMIFGGFYIQSNSIPVYLIWVKYISWFYYGNAALQTNQWDDVMFDCQLCNGDVLPYDECPRSLQQTGQSILVASGFQDMSIWFSIGMMGVLTVGYRFIGYLILLWKFRD